jgi:hypothetical protein
MGCHTWFLKPVTESEFNIFRENAFADAKDLYIDTDEEDEYTIRLYKLEYNKIIYSLENNTDYWWKRGLGNRVVNDNNGKHVDIYEQKQEYTTVINGKLYIDLVYQCNPMFPDLERFHDIFRVGNNLNYPRWIIHNRRELRKRMKKKYFDLTPDQLCEIDRFFEIYPDGIITFG